ncbi:MAG: flagellar basal body-associated protein FliL, partial [Lachnospiraceae bacterium]|nr:flagellar basal body-associated protein FliL [Lachnospiraceae bacterium]
MKKNMLTIVVIALCILNLALTAMVVFSVVPTVKATNNLISQVASIIDLELESPDPKYTVSMSDLTAVEFEGTLTINLKKVEGEKNDPF